MGDELRSETLEEGFVDPKLLQPENPCNKIPEEMDSVSLCNLSNKCTADVVTNGHLDVNNVKIAGKLGHGSIIEESMLGNDTVGNNELNKGCSSNNHPVNKSSVLGNADEINHNDVPNLERDLKLSGNVGIQIGQFEGRSERGDDVSLSHDPSSQKMIEVPGNGINLFVEVFGPLDGISENGKECSFEKNRNVAPGVKDSIFKNEGVENVGDQECTFEVGDLVWAKTRTPLWWPGMISDPSNDETKPEERGSFLVKYFGNANFVWCNNSDLKPFIEYYEQLSGQSTSRSFCGSMEGALCEIGRRVKSTMTCPCFSKVNENSEENLISVDNRGKREDALSLSRFEPTTFLSCIKLFASFSCPPSKIEVTVTKHRVLSFYRSVGRRELPLHMILELKYEDRTNDNNNIYGGREKSVRAKKKRNPSDYNDLASGGKIASSGKGSESRERKKSKFLSSLFLDSNNKEQETGSCNGKNSKKKGLGKSLKGRHVISKADDINAPSSELLVELRSASCDYFYLDRSKYSDSLRRFYISFRSHAFQDADIADKGGGAQPASNREKHSLKKSSNVTKRQKKGDKSEKKGSEKPTLNLACAKESVDNAVGKKKSKKVNSIAKESVLSTSTEKREERVVSAGLESENNYQDISCTIGLRKTSSDVPKKKTSFKKRDEANPGLPNGVPIPILPDLNKDSPISVEHVLFCGPSKVPFKPPSQQRKEGLVVTPNTDGVDRSAKDVAWPTQNILQFDIGIINDANQCRDAEPTTREVGPTAGILDTGLGSVMQQSSGTDIFLKTEPRKRKRNRRTCEMASVIPDLNGNALELTNTSDKTTSPYGNIRPPEGGKPQQKRANKEEDPGGSLSLNFAPGSDLPSREELVATFSRFGLLRESETRVLNGSTVQIAYERTSDVRFAFRSLEKSHSFGKSLVSFDLNCVQEKKIEKKVRKSPLANVGACKNRGRPVEKPDMAFMKQNVEMMKSTLEKMGDKVPPEMRVKLETEIRVFLDRIGSLSGCSSS